MSMTRTRSQLLLITGLMSLALLTWAETAYATSVTYNNFGPGDSFNGSAAWGPIDSVDGIVGETFTPSTSGTLASIVLALEYGAGDTGTVSVDQDSGGKPGGVLESFGVSNLPAYPTSSFTPITVNDTLSIPLLAGTPYWIVVSTDSTSDLYWNWNSTGATGSRARSFDGGTTWNVSPDNTLGAFRVTQNDAVAPVPEPASLVLLGTGLIGAGVRRYRGRAH